MTVKIINGDCLEAMRAMPDNSVDSIVTDPPYGLSFMGKRWDYDVPSVELWTECLRVLKPGGHLLAFAGTRTQHRMAVRIEDAGFEIRDMIAWVYGSGFPKSLNIAKAVDSQLTVGGSSQSQMRQRDMGDEYRPHRNAGSEGFGDGNLRKGADGDRDMSAAADLQTDAARQWQGWGTALKPALEPITVARKPLIGTVAENVLAHGTGALNIDGCRVPGAPEPTRFDPTKHGHEGWRMNATGAECAINASPLGRWPANLIRDGSEEVLAAFPDAKGQQGDLRQQDHAVPQGNAFGQYGPKRAHAARVETETSAARFFYCAKASKADRDEGLGEFHERTEPGHRKTNLETADRPHLRGLTPRRNVHPTVKPTALMRYLCRLVTPPGGVVLDPFMGSGSTGKAAVLEGFRFIGIEREAEYCEIAEARLDYVAQQLALESAQPQQSELFGSAA